MASRSAPLIHFFRCKQCPYRSKYKSVIDQHSKLHKTQNQLFDCAKPIQEEKTNSEINNNKENEPPKTKKMKSFSYSCQHCSYVTEKSSDIKNHIIVKHTSSEEIKWFQCDQCNSKFKLKAYLHNHIKAKHTDPKDIDWFHCPYCLYKSKRKFTLKKHVARKHQK